MNSLLLEMVAARAGGAANPVVADVLARVRSSSGVPGNPISPELIAQLGTGNPMISLLAKHLAESPANGRSRETVIDVEPVENEVPGRKGSDPQPVDANSDDTIKELRSHVESMFAELNQLRERIDVLASALGACCLCWGQDTRCRMCRGRGHPGFSVPDEDLFEEFVLPAIHTLRAQKVKSQPSSPRVQPETSQGG